MQMLIIPLNLDSVLLLLHNSKLAYLLNYYYLVYFYLILYILPVHFYIYMYFFSSHLIPVVVAISKALAPMAMHYAIFYFQ